MTTAVREEEQVPAPVYAEKLKPLLEEASKAYGSQLAGSPARVASDQVNKLILEYVEAGGKMPALARELDGHIGLSGLRRRVRLARALRAQGEEAPKLGHAKQVRGTRDPELVKEAAQNIARAREVGGRVYGDAVREAASKGIALQAIANELEISYFALWSAKRSAY